MTSSTERRTFFSGFNLIRFQLVLLGIAISIRAIRWAFHIPTRLPNTILYTFISGNVVIFLLFLTRRWYENRSRPWNWIMYLLILAITAPIANLAAEIPTYYIFFSPVWGVSFRQSVIDDLPFAILATLIVGIVIYVIGDGQAQLEAQHLETERKLQSQVQLGLSERESLQSDLNQAQEIQKHLLPSETPQIAGYQIACAWQPARSVSGDYFDVLPLGNGRVALCLADVAGKGMAAALLMANLQASVKAFAHQDLSPAAMCSKLNLALCENIASGRFVTLFYAVLDENQRVMQYENAGHCLPLLVRKDGSIAFPEASSGVLGLFSHWTYNDHSLELASGDVLIVVTDGVLEAWNADEEEFGYQRLIASVLASRDQGAHGIRKRVLEDVTAFCERHFQDDASLIVVTVD
jgi:sigma-B regulation protein RsbU (phosphoserine phosphatase)